MISADITCPDCGSKDTYEDEDRGEIVCSDCGLIIEESIMVDSQGSRPSKSIMESPQEYDQRLSKEEDEFVAKNSSGEFDPEWADSPVQVYSAKTRKNMEQTWEDWKGISLEEEANKSVQRSPAARLLDEANTYLGTNPSSTFDRSELFRPFFGLHSRGVSQRMTEDKLRPTATSLSATDQSAATKSIADAASNRTEEFRAKVSDERNLPGPVCTLLNSTGLPPRKYHVPGSVSLNGTEGFDSIAKSRRIDFELYLDLNQIQNKPWPLHLWSEQILSGKGVREVLQKGGALSRKAGEYLLDLNHRSILKHDVSGFIQNLLDLEKIDFPSDIREEIEVESFGLLEEFSSSQIEHDGITTNLLDLFVQHYCLAAYQDSSTNQRNATLFWRFDEHKQIQRLSNLTLISTPIAFAVATTVASKGHSCGSLLEIAHTDCIHGLTNNDNLESLNQFWKFSLQEIERDDLLSSLPL
ncbi:MAG: hypothetical protein CL734_00875 [Chloroflexi bacterium]|nr:hypothetical protein [Chloroflexota bacterium]|tara:strand:+ start:3635 stop:5041 length:1407 start_codon:yes stop_codon:yes gene_type:complete